MKRLVPAISVLLLGIAPCLAASAQEPQQLKGIGGLPLAATGRAGEHSDHASPARPSTRAALLVSPVLLTVGRPQELTIHVGDRAGKPIERFAVQHGKLMHLIVVSKDLKYFDHLHPEYLGKGRFRVTAHLPADGKYTAFADYLPQGGTRQVGVQTLKVGRTDPAPTKLLPDAALSKTVGNLTVTLLLDPKAIPADKKIPITFLFKDAAGNPVTDLQPYLGAMGHLVVIKQSPVPTAADYLHAHPEGHGESGKGGTGAMAGMKHDHDAMPGMDHGPGALPGGISSSDPTHANSSAAPGQVTFETTFPGPGTYKLWGQFKRGGRVITADYTIAL